MVNKTPRPNYTTPELKHELSRVFSSVYFVDKRAKKKLNDSYFLNFDNLIRYAREHHIDEKKYIHGVQESLLQMPATYLVHPFYTKYELKRALTSVFDSVYFDDKQRKLILQDSFFMNFDSIVDYAQENNLDQMEYIKGIRQMLLEIPGCRER